MEHVFFPPPSHRSRLLEIMIPRRMPVPIAQQAQDCSAESIAFQPIDNPVNSIPCTKRSKWSDGGASVFLLRTSRVERLEQGSRGTPEIAAHLRQVRYALLPSQFLHTVASDWSHRRYGERTILSWLFNDSFGENKLLCSSFRDRDGLVVDSRAEVVNACLVYGSFPSSHVKANHSLLNSTSTDTTMYLDYVGQWCWEVFSTTPPITRPKHNGIGTKPSPLYFHWPIVFHREALNR